MYYQSMWGMHAGWWLFWLFCLAFVAVLFWRPWSGGDKGGRGRETPHAVLHRRLASGEITPEDYEARKAILDRDAGRSNSQDGRG